jgi:hypothetical protein
MLETQFVEIVRGPLAGVRGSVIRWGSARIVLAVKLIRQTAVVEIHPADIVHLRATHGELNVHRCWFQTMTFFLTREVRSPALDHVAEEREIRAAEGYPRWCIELMTGTQCLALVVYTCWGLLWDVLNPFKSRRA